MLFRSPEIYIHKLNSIAGEAIQRHGSTARLRNAEVIRILNPSRFMNWYDANEAEQKIYSRYFISRSNEEYKRSLEMGPTGFIEEGKFKLRDPTLNTAKASTGSGSSIRRGKVCTTWDKINLADIMYKIDYPLDGIIPLDTTTNIDIVYREIIANSDKIFPKDYTKKQREDIISTWTEEMFRYYYTISTSGKSKSYFCSLIQEHMEKTGRMSM